MKQYIKNNQIKTRQQIVIVKNGMRTINPTEEQILADGWVEYIPPVIETPEIEGDNKDEIVEDIVEEEIYSPLDNTIEIPVPDVSDKAAFVRARHKLRNVIQSYDISSEVNCFYMQDEPMWLDFENRSRLLLRFQAETAKGNETTTLWSNGKEYALPLVIAINMLYELEVYASKCYDNTQRHLATINALSTIDEVNNYDYKTGYPEKLRF